MPFGQDDMLFWLLFPRFGKN